MSRKVTEKKFDIWASLQTRCMHECLTAPDRNPTPRVSILEHFSVSSSHLFSLARIYTHKYLADASSPLCIHTQKKNKLYPLFACSSQITICLLHTQKICVHFSLERHKLQYAMQNTMPFSTNIVFIDGTLFILAYSGILYPAGEKKNKN